ncbi:Hypothetical protein NTJ_02176 [Nesidiocoris tenuis]|uniref:Uncharacterized protein n=1 Tax=Nesidiocoris tenuis TaxID=355587 RepID=A0ABN7ADX4_9HEMI|nr:Hypothetical protein NTJ_02176 [Nesidiocoris tenuis]
MVKQFLPGISRTPVNIEEVDEVERELDAAIVEAKKSLNEARKAYPEGLLPKKLINAYEEFDKMVNETRASIAEARAGAAEHVSET